MPPRIYVGDGSALRFRIGSNFDNDYPATNGFYVRFDNGYSSGVGYELFFKYNGGLYFRCEGGGGWKKIIVE